ncbi:MAG: MoaD/ThiS family protein [Thermomicrobiales bacterium]|nr:MoaD/ThiS family protein [Thermomicrobiales bacterium]
MQITVKYPGIIGDMLERKSEQVTLPVGATVEDLFRLLTAEDDTEAAILKQTRAFINGQQASRANVLQEGAEVLFMRPIAGG